MAKLPALPFVRAGVSEGLSANQAFRQYQAAAREATAQTGQPYTASRRTVFLQMYSEARMARQRIGQALNAPKDIPGGGLTPQQRTTQFATGYGNWVSIFHRPIGSAEVERFYYLAKSSQPLTPAEAEARARADFEAAAQNEHGTVYRSVIEGVIFTGVEQYNPIGRA